MIKRHWFKITVFIILLFIGLWKGCEVTHKEEIQHVPKIDTVPGNFVLPEIKPNVAPKEIKVFKKKDTTLRKQAEKKDIILDIKITDGHIVEAVIDTAGVVKEVILDIPVTLNEEVKEVVIVPEGVQVKEKTKAGKFLQRVGKGVKKAGKGIVIGLAVVGAVAIAIVASGG